MEKRGSSGPHRLSDIARGYSDTHLIIVALDGSALASRAIPPAAHFAEELGVPLLLIQILQSSRGDAARDEAVRRSQAEGYLDAMKRSLTNPRLRLETLIDDLEGARLRTLMDNCPNALLLTSKAVVSVDSPLSRLELALEEKYPSGVLVNDWS